jgi:hypothetical protein
VIVQRDSATEPYADPAALARGPAVVGLDPPAERSTQVGDLATGLEQFSYPFTTVQCSVERFRAVCRRSEMLETRHSRAGARLSTDCLVWRQNGERGGEKNHTVAPSQGDRPARARQFFAAEQARPRREDVLELLAREAHGAWARR